MQQCSASLPPMPVVFGMLPQGQGMDYYSAFGGQGHDQQFNTSWQGVSSDYYGSGGQGYDQQFKASWKGMSRSAQGTSKDRRKEQPRANEATTICFQNIPNRYSRKMIFELLDSNGFEGTYDFVYLPHDFKWLPEIANLGYVFVNFHSHNYALRAWEKFVGFGEWTVECDKVMAATWASTTQGKVACIERFKNSPVMHELVPPECKPVLIENGAVVHLTPTKKITKQPRFKSGYGLKFSSDVSADASESTCSGISADASEGTCCDASDGTTVAEEADMPKMEVKTHRRTSSGSTIVDSDSDAPSVTNSVESSPSISASSPLSEPVDFGFNAFALPYTEDIFEVTNTFIELKQPPTQRRGRSNSL